MTESSDKIVVKASNVASKVLIEADAKSTELRNTAEAIAQDLIETAKETARQMLLHTNLDTSKIPLICNKIVKIEESLAENTLDTNKIKNDISWIKWLVMGETAGIGVIITGLLIAFFSKVI